jgi:hypothetical protein
MPVTIEDLAARLSAMEDKEAIRRLKSRYLRACDLKKVEVVRDCFLAEGVRIAYQNFPVFTDRDAFVAVFEQMACQGGVYDLHHATNWEIDLDGPGPDGRDRARGLFSLAFRTILTGPRQVVRLVVEYEDMYVRHDGRWWIADTVSKVTSMLTEQIGEDGSVTMIVLAEPAAPAA